MRVIFLLAFLAVSTFAEPATAQEGLGLPPPATMPPDLTGDRPAPVPGGFGYPILEGDRERILDLLRQSQFDELDRFFESLEKAVVRDIRREVDLIAAYEAFFGSDTSIAPHLDEWTVRSDPESEASLVARAQFQMARALEAGYESTPEEADSVRRTRVDGFLSAGFHDASVAARLDPQNLAAYGTMLDFELRFGWSAPGEDVLGRALTQFPASYWIRNRALSGMTPRKGGSYERMRDFVDEAQRYLPANPRLGTLLGAVGLDQANELSREGRSAEALEKLEEVREFGPPHTFFYQRGRIYFAAKDYVRALAELDSAIARPPVAEMVLEYRGRTLALIARELAPPDRRTVLLEQAEIDLAEAAVLSPFDSLSGEWLAWTSRMKARCAASPTDCFEARNTPANPSSEPDQLWEQILLFIISLPVALYLFLAEGHELLLLPAPLIAVWSILWNFAEWRRQRFWTPRVIHLMSALSFVTMVIVHLKWGMVGEGGAEWTGPLAVIASCSLVASSSLFPYVIYLLVGGPRYMAKRGLSPDEPAHDLHARDEF